MKMKLFEVQTDLTSYTYPVIKIVVCLTIIIFGIVRNYFVHFSSPRMEIFVAIIWGVLAIVSILCLYISIIELLETHGNRKYAERGRTISLSGKQILLDKIVNLACENDIVEIEISTDRGIIKIGTSSDCKSFGGELFDKRYYIGEREFVTITEFQAELSRYSTDEFLLVLSIDEVDPKYYNLK